MRFQGTKDEIVPVLAVRLGESHDRSGRPRRAGVDAAGGDIPGIQGTVIGVKPVKPQRLGVIEEVVIGCGRPPAGAWRG